MSNGQTSNLTQCPHCLAISARRSKSRNWLEHWLPYVGMRVFRCRECQQRFWQFGRRPAVPVERAKVLRPEATRREVVQRQRAKRRQELTVYWCAAAAFLLFLYFITQERGGL